MHGQTHPSKEELGPWVIRKKNGKDEVGKLVKTNFVKEIRFKWRMCVDFRVLNNACPKDLYIMPCINQLIDATFSHEFLSIMDAYYGYNQIKMIEKDVSHTAFYADNDISHFVMLFGLINVRVIYHSRNVIDRNDQMIN